MNIVVACKVKTPLIPVCCGRITRGDDFSLFGDFLVENCLLKVTLHEMIVYPTVVSLEYRTVVKRGARQVGMYDSDKLF
jgi:hypothetical protein